MKKLLLSILSLAFLLSTFSVAFASIKVDDTYKCNCMGDQDGGDDGEEDSSDEE